MKKGKVVSLLRWLLCQSILYFAVLFYALFWLRPSAGIALLSSSIIGAVLTYPVGKIKAKSGIRAKGKLRSIVSDLVFAISYAPLTLVSGTMILIPSLISSGILTRNIYNTWDLTVVSVIIILINLILALHLHGTLISLFENLSPANSEDKLKRSEIKSENESSIDIDVIQKEFLSAKEDEPFMREQLAERAKKLRNQQA